MEEREAALKEEVERADRAHEALTQAYKDSLVEIGELRATIEHERAALAERQAQVERVTEERDEARAEAKKAKRENRLLKVVLAIELLSRIATIVH